MSIVGVIVAGGRAARFGADKALAEVDGQPMIARVADVLRPACDALAVNAREGSGAAAWASARGLPILPDPAGAEGPLAGIVSGLEWAQAQPAAWLVTAPCDTPWLPVDLVPRLAAQLGGGAPCAIAAVGEELHPLCAIWRVEHSAAVRSALTSGARHPPLRRLAIEMGAEVAQFHDRDAFANVNTPEDLPRLRDR